MGSAASSRQDNAGRPENRTPEAGGGRRRLLYAYGGRRYDITAFVNRHKRDANARANETSAVTSATETTTSSASSMEVHKPPKVTSVDLATHLFSNRDDHHTYEYDSQELILRRGQPFQFAISFERPYDKEKDEIILEFRTGKKPSLTKGTRVKIPISQELIDGKWGAKTDTVPEDNTLTLRVQSSANCPIGLYTMSVITKPKDVKDPQSRYDCDKPVYFLFNPWCEQDAVYMENEVERKEFVLEDTGYIWYGSYKQIGKRRWNFGQFEDSAFDAAMYLLQDTDYPIPAAERGNPIIVSRRMSAAINEQDDGGVLVGRWDGHYSDGERPTSWNGSVAILEQYMKEKISVKYGQCWVFSGVLTTILRSLGIPARSVTNYASAHDTDTSMTIDKHFDCFGESIEWLDDDSIWNFHVWNDCWMARPDLPPGYGGWQAVDATPQETSEGIFQAGPASLNAIKQGHVYLPYDTRFIFAEINGDVVYWESDGTFLEKLRTEASSVGRGLYTKAVRQNEGEDIRGAYKHGEGSKEERLAVECAIQHGSKPYTYCSDVHEEDDVSFAIETVDRIYVGSDFDVKIKLTNKSADERNVSMSVIVQVCYYTGVLAEKVKTEQMDVAISGSGETESVFHVTVDDYVDKLVDQSAMKIFFMGKVKETKRVLAAQDDFRLRTPDVDVSVSDSKLKVGQELTAEIMLKNPLPRKLTHCCFNLEGAGLQRTKTIWLNDIEANGEVKQVVTLKTHKPGKRTLVVDFDSDQLSQVHGDVDLDVVKV